jgi:hypothetical protein
MLKANTVLIIGAGASIDYGYPSGNQLLAEVREECWKVEQGDLSNVYGWNLGGIERVAELRKLIDTQRTFDSIDELLSVHRSLMDVGKFMIALRLLPRENKDAIINTERKRHWMLDLFRAADEDRIFSHFFNNNLTFITFNYDRVLDFYLRHYTMERYPETTAQGLAEVAKAFPIIHVHGDLGEISQRPFAEDVDLKKWGASQITNASKRIQIIHEADPDSTQFRMAQLALNRANRVGFLGFGYHNTNIERLKLRETLADKMVIGTAYRMGNQQIVKARTAMQARNAIYQFHDCDCSSLINNTELILG